MIRRSLASLVLALSALAAVGARADDQEKRLTILYTTDIHAHYLPHNKAGGMAALEAKVKQIRAEAKDPVFLFDSGDMLSGHPASELDYQGIKGGALFAMMNVVGYDAWCIGNHDFDNGRANLSKVVSFLKFPSVSANLHADGDPPLGQKRWTIIEKGGIKVGVFGLILESLDKVVKPDKMVGVHVSSTTEAAKEAVAELTSKCDLIVCLSHCGSDEDVKLADRVKGINVILSGHNHRPLLPAFHANKTLVTEGHIWSEQLGRLDLKLKNGHTHFDSEMLKLPDVAPEGEMKKIVEDVDAAVGPRVKEVLGTLDTPWKRENKAESNIGNFFSDGLREFAKADCAFLNSGGIRSNHEAGSLTYLDVYEIFPFPNTVVTFELSGEDLKTLCHKNANAQLGDQYGILQVSGVRYEFKGHGKNAEITKVTVNGEPLDPKKTYKCASNDFVVDQHDKYFGQVTLLNTTATESLLCDVAEEYVRAQAKKGPIKSVLEDRMKRTD
ncbi:MAG TPA: bifunctional UDP-sugar hydrolase/5'-nucleotidase [Planctomycetota bacterium]|nr:bifunctional UDP-sugar hydrolase/5'-nucleotidase [Planctomycetota bacterium]